MPHSLPQPYMLPKSPIVWLPTMQTPTISCWRLGAKSPKALRHISSTTTVPQQAIATTKFHAATKPRLNSTAGKAAPSRASLSRCAPTTRLALSATQLWMAIPKSAKWLQWISQANNGLANGCRKTRMCMATSPNRSTLTLSPPTRWQST